MKLPVLATFGLLCATFARAEFIFFDGFESPETPGFTAEFSPGWDVTKTSPDQVGIYEVGSNAHQGSQVADFNAYNLDFGGAISRSITTIMGQEYQVSLYYYSFNSAGSAVRLDFGSAFTSATAADANTWTELTLNFTATSTSTLLSITDVTTGNTVIADLWVDSVSVSTVPEPTTGLLVGLGLATTLALRGRRLRA